MPEGATSDPQPAASQGDARGRTFDWQDSSDRPDDDPVPTCDPSISPTVTITLEEQRKDPSLALIMAALRDDPKVPRRKRERVADKYELRDDGLHRLTILDGEPSRALCVPSHLRAAILARFHYTLLDGGGHSGGQQLYDQISVNFFWPDMERECHAFTAACETCGGLRSQPTIGAHAATAPTPGRAFEVIHVDHKGPLPMCDGCTHVLVVVCALTRFTLFIPVKSTTAECTFDALHEHVFSVFGYPLVIVSDNGSAFANKLMQATEKLFGFRWIHVMPHTPQANGLAEAAVKKLKLILDRHTREYSGWRAICAMAQASVNQRNSFGHKSSPYAALFGRAAVTLSALEQPSLLPGATPEQQRVQSLAVAMDKLHNRLRQESDRNKELAAEAARASAPAQPLPMVPAPGDKVWLIYSDSERARYIRKHGHGKPWRHAFTVKDTRPHAVLLEVPKDGSVPDVLPWQSLRKCSFAAPHFHDEDMPRPTVDSRGLPVVDNDDDTPAGADPLVAQQPPADDPNGWASWTPQTEYTIERIVSASKVGGGWRLMVKWEGYPDPTPEPLGQILRTVRDPHLLEQIEQCKQDHLLQNPQSRAGDLADTADTAGESDKSARRTLPSRARSVTQRLILHISSVRVPETIIAAVDRMHRAVTARCRGLHLLRDNSDTELD